MDACTCASRLSRREVAVLTALANGMRNDRVAHCLGITRSTVEFHLRNARHKLRANTREQAVALAVRCGVVVVACPSQEATLARESGESFPWP